MTSPHSIEIANTEQALPIKFVSVNGQCLCNNIDLASYFAKMKGTKSMMAIK